MINTTRLVVLGALAGLGILTSVDEAQAQCLNEETVEGGMFAYHYEPSFTLDSMDRSESSVEWRVHAWLRSPRSGSTVTARAYYLDESDANITQTSNWNSIGSSSVSLGTFTFFSFNPFTTDERAIPSGGLGRYRATASWSDPCTGQEVQEDLKPYLAPALPPQGTNNRGHRVYSGVFGDTSVRPSNAENTAYLGLDREKFNPFLGALGGQAAAELETDRYYKSVNINPHIPEPSAQQVEADRAQCRAAANQLCSSCRGCSQCIQQHQECSALSADDYVETISSGVPNLAAFRARYFPAGINQTTNQPGIGKEIVTSYYNEGDLGIGREMHCNFRLGADNVRERACYVFNFAPCTQARQANGLCTAPRFGAREEAILLQTGAADLSETANPSGEQDVPFAAVAMVERDVLKGEPDSMFFAVYACQSGNCDNLANHTLFTGPVALDNHGVAGEGSNTFNPGNCLSCHGGGGAYKPATHVSGSTYLNDASTTGAFFLPFDMAVFGYWDGNSKADNLARMRAMNKYIAEESHLATALDQRGEVNLANTMISTWYDGDFENGTFNSARVPREFEDEANPVGIPQYSSTVRGATTHSNAGNLYANVYAKACRGCHIAQPELQLASASFWRGAPAFFKGYLCDDNTSNFGNSNSMPLAEKTQDIVWDDLVRQRFFAATGLSNTDCAPQNSAYSDNFQPAEIFVEPESDPEAQAECIEAANQLCRECRGCSACVTEQQRCRTL